MANIVLFDHPKTKQQLLPLTFTKPIAYLRCGIYTNHERWSKQSKSVKFLTETYLAANYPSPTEGEYIFVNAAFITSNELVDQILNLKLGECLTTPNNLIATHCQLAEFKNGKYGNCTEIDSKQYIEIANPWDIFAKNDAAIRLDFANLNPSKSQSLSNTMGVIGNNVYVEEGFEGNYSIINSETGPVYLGKDAKILEGAVIRGPFALNNNAVVKMSAKIYGATTVGPYSKVGGEINNSVINGYSNKGHDGFLGNAVIGDWCNLGADTNNSNLKNNYDEVKLWSYETQSFQKTGLQFCGLVLGDHSKCGINTMFNTGTVVGVSANIFGAGFPRNYIPSFTWGGTAGFSTYKIEKALQTMERVMSRRTVDLTDEYAQMMKTIFENTKKYRNWEK